MGRKGTGSGAGDWILGAAMAGIAAAELLILDSQLERNTLTVKNYEIRSAKIRKDTTAVFLSDLHEHVFGAQNSELIEKIEEPRPALLLFGGDMITAKSSAEFRQTLLLAETLAARHPVYYAEGNHELRFRRDHSRYGFSFDAFRRELTEAGVVLLADCSVRLPGNLTLSGLLIPERLYAKAWQPKGGRMTAEEVRAKIGEADPERFEIVLAHSPRAFDACAEWGADLTLSGHYHGGTVKLPGGAGLMTPQFEFFRRDVAGMHERDGHRMIVSPGLGTHSINVRINNRPEIDVIRLRSGM